jgi:hypothetical protein
MLNAGLKVCVLGKVCLAPIQPILVAQVTILGANINFGDEQINIFRSTATLVMNRSIFLGALCS